jgi:Zn-dependent alcohol dehydrogenase
VATRVRAAVLERPGASLLLEELLLEEPSAGEVQVRLGASGICHSDLHLAQGDWGDPGPIVLGHEAAGIVEAIGDGVSFPAIGDRVVLTWCYPCLACRWCQRGRQWLCDSSGSLRHRQRDGSSRLRRENGSEVLAYLALGAFSERVVVPAQAAVPVSDELPAEVGALIGCCVSTGVGAVMNTARVEPGASVAVLGLGGVGLSAVMGSALAGAGPIVAVDTVKPKLARARRLGATHTVEAGDPEETVRAIRHVASGGVDYVFEAVGAATTIEQSTRVLGRGGTAVLVGLTPFRTRPSFDAFRLVDQSQSVVGSNYGYTTAALDFPRWADLYLAGRLPVDELIEERVSLEEVGESLDSLRRAEGLRRVVVFD